MRKVERQPDGTQAVLEFTGPPNGKGSERRENWREVLTIGKDEIVGSMVRLSAETQCGPFKGGVLVVIGGVRHGMTVETAEELLTGLESAIQEAKNAASPSP